MFLICRKEHSPDEIIEFMFLDEFIFSVLASAGNSCYENQRRWHVLGLILSRFDELNDTLRLLLPIGKVNNFSSYNEPFRLIC